MALEKDELKLAAIPTSSIAVCINEPNGEEVLKDAMPHVVAFEGCNAFP